MRPDCKKLLLDIEEAADSIMDFVDGRNFEDYEDNALIRSAVERQFEIIGEALSKLGRMDQELVERIPEYRRIISFRNILIHGYAQVDDRIVWDILESKLPRLRRAVQKLLEEP